MIIASILFYLSLSLFVSISVYGRFNFLKFIQLFFLITFGLNILICLVLDLFKAVDNAPLFLVLQIVICILLSLVVRRHWPLQIKDYRYRLGISFSEFHWFDLVLIVLMGTVLSAFFVVGVTTPPNNLDSLDPTGITRIFYWMQEATLDFGSPTGLASIFDPQFFHMQGIWLFSLGKSEYLFFLVQWFSLLVSTVTIFKISRSLGFSITNSLISALVSLSLPVVLLQTYSFQGDLTVAVLILVCISFVIDWLKSKDKFELFFVGLAFVFALGTKKAAFLAIPVFALLILFWIISRIRNKRIIPWVTGSAALIIIAGFILVGQLIIKQGGVLAGVQLIYDRQVSTENISEKFRYTTPRFLYQFIGLDGLPRVVQNTLIPIKADLFQNTLIPSTLDLQKEVFLQPGFDEVEKFSYSAPLILSEEGAWFGPIGFLLIPIAVILTFFSRQKTRRIYAGFALILFLSFFIMVIIQRPGWDPYQGRYFILPVLPLIPLISMILPTNKVYRTVIIIVILPICLFLSLNSFFANNSRPVVTAGSIWGFQYQHILNLPENNKYELYVKNKLITSTDQIASAALDRPTIYQSTYWEQVYFSGFRMLGNIQFIDSLVPDDATLYLDFPSTSLDYGLFGKKKDRTLFRLYDISQVSSGYYLTASTSVVTQQNDLNLLGDNGVYKIYLIN
ncbi:MAG: hypothetical protein CVU43_07165 [Chloroflexi bacterium HGW-Chloroflexi-5]|jgi:hypothetical protein|nr:MAG: hypothetical protein CVU43_07165 [Chloroflexi bacterium HGW-Chloroflexi-5]